MHYATTLPLHGGKAPRWLFGRMVKLGGEISNVIIDEFGADELLRRIGDKDWFQAFSCAIGYDWHSSGTTTVTMGALKEALNPGGEVYIAGGKGKAGTKTPEDIVKGVDALSIPGSAEKFTEYSRLAAKIDSSMVYENIGIYHHTFMFSKSKKWTVVQQAMQNEGNKAIRFQWFSDLVSEKDIANEPHSGIASEVHASTLDLTYNQNKDVREGMPAALEEYKNVVSGQYPDRHGIVPQIDMSRRGLDMIRKASEVAPKDYRQLLLDKGRWKDDDQVVGIRGKPDLWKGVGLPRPDSLFVQSRREGRDTLPGGQKVLRLRHRRNAAHDRLRVHRERREVPGPEKA